MEKDSVRIYLRAFGEAEWKAISPTGADKIRYLSLYLYLHLSLFMHACIQRAVDNVIRRNGSICLLLGPGMFGLRWYSSRGPHDFSFVAWKIDGARNLERVSRRVADI